MVLNNSFRILGRTALFFSLSMALAGCLPSAQVDSPASGSAAPLPPTPTPPPPPPPGQNSPPSISGNPGNQAVSGQTYSFVPNASDADGDRLTFTIQSLPAWATFNAADGSIAGTPDNGDVATYGGISITVSDGQNSATLGPFTITVDALAMGSAQLSWTPPAVNTDGSALTDLAGYRIYWGASSGSYTQSATLDNPGLTTYVVENLTAGNWYFVSTAMNAAGAESNYSNEAQKTVN